MNFPGTMGPLLVGELVDLSKYHDELLPDASQDDSGAANNGASSPEQCYSVVVVVVVRCSPRKEKPRPKRAGRAAL